VVYQDVTRNKNISAATKGLYAYLSSFCGVSDECYPSVETILKEMSMGRDTFYRHMNALVAAGIIKKKQTINENGKFGRTVYHLTHEVVISDWLCGLSEEKGLKPEIKTYRDVAIKILELLKIDSFPYKFQLDLFKEDCDDSPFPESNDWRYIRVIRIPEKPELLKFFETYEDLQKLLRDGKIKQHVIDTWLDGALEELNEIIISIPDEINDELPFDVE